jgi:hypothetical protein
MTLCAICTGFGDAVANAVVVAPAVDAAVAGEAIFEAGAEDGEAAGNAELSFVTAELVVVDGIVLVTSSVRSLLFVAAVSCIQNNLHEIKNNECRNYSKHLAHQIG